MANGESFFLIYLISAMGLVIAYALAGFNYFLKHFKKNKGKTSKEIDYIPLTYFSIFIFLSIGRAFLVIFDILTDFSGAAWGSENFYLWQIGMTLQIIGFGIFFTLMEKRIMRGRDKYILVITYFTIFIVGLIIGVIFIVILAFLFAVYIPAAYLYISIKTKGIVKKKSLLVFCGLLLIVIASIFVSGPIASALPIENILVHTLTNSIKIVGVVFIFMGFREY